MIKKLTFFLNQTLTKWNYDRFGFDILRQNGFEIKIIDFTPYLYPEVYQWEIVNEKQIGNIEICLVHDLETALAIISKLTKDNFIISLIPYNNKTTAIYQALSETNSRYAGWVGNAFPSLSRLESRALYYRELLNECFHNPKRLWLKVLNKVRNRKLNEYKLKTRGATLLLAGGKESIIEPYFPVDDKTEILWLHQLDYDVYLNEVESPIDISDKCVFLSSYGSDHPYSTVADVNPKVNDAIYYFQMNRLFNAIENNLGLQVEIATHPRMTYINKANPYDNRLIRNNETARAVRESKLVVAHQSTATNYAVLFNKPVLFVVFNTWPSFITNDVYAIAHCLGKEVIFADDINTIDWNNVLEINSDRYEQYKHSYIKTAESPNLPFWQIVADRLKRMDNKG